MVHMSSRRRISAGSEMMPLLSKRKLCSWRANCSPPSRRCWVAESVSEMCNVPGLGCYLLLLQWHHG